MRIIVAGIDTDVGKTVVSAILTEALNGHYWKPVQCGLPTDRGWVESMLSAKNRCYPEGFFLSTPCSPHLAAKKEGVTIREEMFIPPDCSEPLIIEGAGGLLAPLNAHASWANAAIPWEAHWILVHRHYLGSLNHFLLSVEWMKQKNIPVWGVVFNGDADEETEEMLLKRANTICLGRLKWQERLTPDFVQAIAKLWRPKILQTLGL